MKGPLGRRRWRRVATCLVVGFTVSVVVAAPAGCVRRADHAERRFKPMTYNVYLGANLQPLFGVTDPSC